ncbi:MAG: thioredoxin family protein [Bacteroidales bacterium]|nr:thioredoxin family protein [Bacteroidales bacterium]
MKIKSKNFQKVFLLLGILVLFSINTFSQILEPVKWTFDKNKISDDEYELIFTAKIDAGWHVYSQYIPDGGPIATSFNFDENKNIELIDSVSEPEPIKEYDKNYKMTLKFFAEKAVFKQKIKVLTKEKFDVTGYLEFMCCDDSRCLPPSEIDFTYKINENSPTIQKADDNQPVKKKKQDNTGTNLFQFFIFAFIGGLIAILTPCVFPMIPMTVSFFMHSSEKKSKAKKQALFFGLSIIVIYTFIGLIVSVTLGPSFINWLSTSWLPNIFFFLIFMIFAFSFFGAFEITLPSWMINKTDKKADKGGYVGAFFMAFTLVLVSFSCTVPIVGTILVEAAVGEVLKPVIGMLGFSLAFALPFSFFAFFPSKLGNLPKSGGWLNTVKVILGFIELALGMKFLMVADQTYHWGLLDREIYIAIWIAIFSVMGLYLLGKIKFSGDSEKKYLSVPRVIASILTFSFVVYLIPGMFGAPLKALSGYLPPMQTHDFNLNKIIRENVEQISFDNNKTDIYEKVKYDDFLELPHGLKGYFDYNQALGKAKEVNKPLFIDFTGHGCVNCREMEANVWSDPRVLKRLKNNFIIAALYVDDKTKLPEADWSKSKYDGKIKKTLGAKYADFQVVYFKSNSQPNYILLDNTAILDPDKIDNYILAKPRGYNLNTDEFVDFLDTAIVEFNKRHKIK